MKGFFKFLGVLTAAVAFVVGILAIADRFCNKNRIKGDYLVCDAEDSKEPEE